MSSVKMVSIELILEAVEAMIAAISAAKTRPSSPVGSSAIIDGYASSGLERSGARMTAAMPGSTMITGISSLRKPANTTPRCASAKLLAANARWMIYWLNPRSEEHTSELQSIMRLSYAVFCLKKKNRVSTKKAKRHVNINAKTTE